jgi:acetylornithine deacetylase/succinyl-diaminopimelate desuccinylase-like protein
MLDEAALGDDAFWLCQKLLQIDTTNPPGNGLRRAEPRVLTSAPWRGDVVARLRGNAAKPPLLLSAHLDIVEAEAATWTPQPFSGVISDGYLDPMPTAAD